MHLQGSSVPDPNHVQELGAWPAAAQGPLQPLVLLSVSAQKMLGHCRLPNSPGRAIATTCASRHWGCRYASQEGPYRRVQVGYEAVPEEITQDIASRYWEAPGTLQSN